MRVSHMRRYLFVKPAIFHRAALDAIRGFPRPVRRAIGEAILKLQHGASLAMPFSRPMPSVAPGVAELRIRERAGVFRTFYYFRTERGILIPHAFVKKTQATPQNEIILARRRLKELIDEAR